MIVVLAIAMSITICSSCCFQYADVDPVIADLITINNNIDFKLNKSDTELDVKIDINSGVAVDAYLILNVSKSMLDYIEGFKDSLRIDDFYVRSYYIYKASIPLDFPVYVKNVFLNKGKNTESFKIVFPKSISSIAGKVNVHVGILRSDDEIKNRFETIGRGDNQLYYEVFPDSSTTSFIFTDSYLLKNLSQLHRNEATKIVSKCPRYSYWPSYYNYDEKSFQLK